MKKKTWKIGFFCFLWFWKKTLKYWKLPFLQHKLSKMLKNWPNLNISHFISYNKCNSEQFLAFCWHIWISVYTGFYYSQFEFVKCWKFGEICPRNDGFPASVWSETLVVYLPNFTEGLSDHISAYWEVTDLSGKIHVFYAFFLFWKKTLKNRFFCRKRFN